MYKRKFKIQLSSKNATNQKFLRLKTSVPWRIKKKKKKNVAPKIHSEKALEAERVKRAC